MLLITLSWIYILFTIINLGFGTDKLISLKVKDFVVTSILGLFSVTVLASIWAIFGRINIEFHVFLLILNGFIFFKYKNSILSVYRNFYNEIKLLTSSLKLFLAIITVLIIAQCASIPYVIDNESYYIQTIKWLNEYGFVKGIVNLYLFLGQVSGWHITQSSFSFSFLYKNFNDLSGFCLFLGNIFAIQKLNEFYKNSRKTYLIVGLLPLVNILFFQFISAPSPDIPVVIFSFIIFFYLLENYEKITVENFNLIVILILFVLYIKNTTLLLILIPILLFWEHYKILSKNLIKPLFISILILALFIVKNMIISGGLIFPSKLFDTFNLSYAIPDSIENFYYDQLKYCGYLVDMKQYNAMSAADLFLRWLSLPKLNGLFNKISILLIIICPFLIYRFENIKKLWVLYGLMVLQLLLLFITSPQYRFFMNFIFFFALFCLVCLIQKRKIIALLLMSSLIPTMIILFVPINLNHFSNNKFILKPSNFSINNIVFPYKNTKFDTKFETIKKGNLKYNSPIDNTFFWGCGDGDLPCVNKIQIDYFETYFYYIPQLRGTDLKDGFYAKYKIPNE